LLGNHVAFVDPGTITLAARRPVQWMANATLWGGRGVAALNWLGIVPKQRFHSDMRAISLIRSWSRAGAIVAVFPEGQMSWDGRLQPLVPGLARLVRLLRVPVLLARLENHYQYWPRWAPMPRFGEVAVHFSPPRTFDLKTPVAEIEAFIQDGLRVNFRDTDLKVRGWRLARGITNVLFLCPKCDAEEMVERGNVVACSACRASWTVDTQHRLTPRQPGDLLLLEEQMDRTQERLKARWASWNPASAAPILQSCPVEWMDHTDQPKRIGSGRLELRPGRLELVDHGVVLWSAALQDLLSASVEFGRGFEIRTADQYAKAKIPTGSAWKLPWAIAWWKAQAEANAESPSE